MFTALFTQRVRPLAAALLTALAVASASAAAAASPVAQHLQDNHVAMHFCGPVGNPACPKAAVS
jgi:hypothetical protein